MSQQNRQRFEFTGSGGEYFGIWIVNLVLSILTLGIYSAWAKVRRMQYFYRHTWLNQANFDYHGDPVAILKGRVIAFVLLLVYNLSGGVSPLLGLIFLIPLSLVMPILLYKSLRFRAINSSYSGLRFGFSAKLSEAYSTFLLWPFLAFISLFVLTPSAHHRLRRFQHGNARFGTTPFHFGAGMASFYKVYGMTLLLLLGLVTIIGLIFGGGAAGLMQNAFQFADPDERHAAIIGFILIGLFGLIVFGALLVGPYFTSRLQNLVWGQTSLGPHQLGSDLSARGLLWIKLTNMLGIMLTFGLFKPFADVRLAKYRLTHMWLDTEGPLDDFVQDAQSNVAAFGEEAAEMFDVDIGL